MDEEINVNRLNGIPNFGHGFPDGEDVQVPAAEVDEIQPVVPSEETPVENTAPEAETPVEAPVEPVAETVPVELPDNSSVASA